MHNSLHNLVSSKKTKKLARMEKIWTGRGFCPHCLALSRAGSIPGRLKNKFVKFVFPFLYSLICR
jgi:hypothetical protein